MWSLDFATKCLVFFTSQSKISGGWPGSAMYGFSTAANDLAELWGFLLLKCMEQIELDNPKKNRNTYFAADDSEWASTPTDAWRVTVLASLWLEKSDERERDV